MNKKDIDNLQAGIETDNLVAEHLFGWHKFQTSNTKFTALMYPCCDICHRPESNGYGGRYEIKQIHHLNVQQIPPYSSLRYAAYTIVDLMLKDGWSLQELSSENGTDWIVIWIKLSDSVIFTRAQSDCLAICKAGLKWKFNITI